MHPPQQLLPWLTCTTNLTHKLHTRSNDTVLKVIQQIWCDANMWDQAVLGLQEELVLHRDIVTLALGEPCWFARTILPATTYQAHVPLFDRLKNEPLGNLIFQGDDIQRRSLRHYLITSETAEYAWIILRQSCQLTKGFSDAFVSESNG